MTGKMSRSEGDTQAAEDAFGGVVGLRQKTGE
jgi:hypothetical protein